MAQRKSTSRGRRQAAKAPVIDLEASEVPEEPTAAPDAEEETTAAAEQDTTADSADDAVSSPQKEAEPEVADTASATDAEEAKSGGKGKLIAAGIAGLLLAGAAGGAWLYRDIGADYFPPAASERQAARLAALETKIARLEASNKDGSAALSKLTSEIEALNTKLQSTSEAVAAKGKAANLATSKANDAIALAEKATAQATQAAAGAEGTKAAATRALEAAEGAIKSTELANVELNSAKTSIDELKAAIAAAAASASSLTGDAGESVKAAQAQISGLMLKLSELERKLDASLAKPQVDPALSQKIGELDTVVAGLKTSLADALQTQKITAARASKVAKRDQVVQALSELTSNAAAGQPFASALAVLEIELASEPALQALSGLASTGVPSSKALLGEFVSVHSALTKASAQSVVKPSGENEAQPSSFLSTLQSRLTSVIKIRPSGAKDWTKLGDEMAAQAKKGNLTEMVQLADQVPETPPAALADWLEKAKSRLALDRNVTALSTKAMQHLAATSKTGG